MSGPALLLDLDRTLIDVQSHTDYVAALADVQALVREWPDVLVPPTDWSVPAHTCLGVLVALTGDVRWPAVSAALAAYEAAAVAVSDPMPGLDRAQLLWTGSAVAVVTLLPADVARVALRRHCVAVDVIVGREPGLRPKPSGDGLLAACRRLGVRPEDAVVVGDSTWDLAAAIDAGTRFIGVPRTSGALPPGTLVAADLPGAIRLATAA